MFRTHYPLTSVLSPKDEFFIQLSMHSSENSRSFTHSRAPLFLSRLSSSSPCDFGCEFCVCVFGSEFGFYFARCTFGEIKTNLHFNLRSCTREDLSFVQALGEMELILVSFAFHFASLPF